MVLGGVVVRLVGVGWFVCTKAKEACHVVAFSVSYYACSSSEEQAIRMSIQ